MMKTFMVFGAAALLTASAALAAPRPFDARNPGDVLSELTANGASGELKHNEKGEPYIEAKSGRLPFNVRFENCDEDFAACKTVLYTVGWSMTTVSVTQINSWNRWVYLCPAYLSAENHPHAWYGLRPSVHDTREDVTGQQKTWLACLKQFDAFTDSPGDFLAMHQ
jgi:hypothetical protein